MMRRMMMLMKRSPRPCCYHRRGLSVAASPPAAAPSAGAAAESGGGGDWERKLKIAAFVLVPLSIPTALVAVIVYDPEVRDDIDKWYPEIVDAVRTHVGFEEDSDARVRVLEQAFISSQPVAVTVKMRTGRVYNQTVSPLKRLQDLYDSVQAQPSEHPIIDIDFDDISTEEVKDPASKPVSEGPDESDLILQQVPSLVRNINKASLWDPDSSSVIQAKKKQPLEELEVLLSDIDEGLQKLNDELKTGRREIDSVMAEIDDLKRRRRQVKADLVRKGRWWHIL